MSILGKLAYLAQWQFRAWTGRRAPLQSVIFISDKCNLRCKHCSVYAIDRPRTKTLQQIREELEDCYKAGSRFVDFEGGELYLWRDGDKDINDVIDTAHETGFWSVTITTNGQLPFNGSHADQIWVSMDGIGDKHDEIRGKGTFKRLEENIRKYAEEGATHTDRAICGQGKDSCRKADVSVNMVINKLNYSCLEETLEYVKQSKYIKSISLNFHTPFSETEELFLEPETRNRLIDTIIKYKKRGYPIMNTYSGLKMMKMHDGVTACGNESCWVTNFIFSDGSRSPKCMGYTHNVCDRCGFSMGGEMYAVMHLRPDTLWGGLKLRLKSL